MKRSQGFTLIELMVGLFILTLVGIMIAGGMNTMLRTQNRLHEQYERFSELQLAMLLLERDFEQLIERPVYDALIISRFLHVNH